MLHKDHAGISHENHVCARSGFGLMIDTARAAPVLIEKHGRGVVVVMSVEEYERLKMIEVERSLGGDLSGDTASGDV